MKLADAMSTGADEMSRFHQLSRGKSGSGPGSAPPSVLAADTTIQPPQRRGNGRQEPSSRRERSMSPSKQRPRRPASRPARPVLVCLTLLPAASQFREERPARVSRIDTGIVIPPLISITRTTQNSRKRRASLSGLKAPCTRARPAPRTVAAARWPSGESMPLRMASASAAPWRLR